MRVDGGLSQLRRGYTSATDLRLRRAASPSILPSRTALFILLSRLSFAGGSQDREALRETEERSADVLAVSLYRSRRSIHRFAIFEAPFGAPSLAARWDAEGGWCKPAFAAALAGFGLAPRLGEASSGETVLAALLPPHPILLRFAGTCFGGAVAKRFLRACPLRSVITVPRRTSRLKIPQVTAQLTQSPFSFFFKAVVFSYPLHVITAGCGKVHL